MFSSTGRRRTMCHSSSDMAVSRTGFLWLCNKLGASCPLSTTTVRSQQSNGPTRSYETNMAGISLNGNSVPCLVYELVSHLTIKASCIRVKDLGAYVDPVLSCKVAVGRLNRERRGDVPLSVICHLPLYPAYCNYVFIAEYPCFNEPIDWMLAQRWTRNGPSPTWCSIDVLMYTCTSYSFKLPFLNLHRGVGRGSNRRDSWTRMTNQTNVIVFRPLVVQGLHSHGKRPSL